MRITEFGSLPVNYVRNFSSVTSFLIKFVFCIYRKINSNRILLTCNFLFLFSEPCSLIIISTYFVNRSKDEML